MYYAISSVRPVLHFPGLEKWPTEYGHFGEDRFCEPAWLRFSENVGIYSTFWFKTFETQDFMQQAPVQKTCLLFPWLLFGEVYGIRAWFHSFLQKPTIWYSITFYSPVTLFSLCYKQWSPGLNCNWIELQCYVVRTIRNAWYFLRSRNFCSTWNAI